MVQLDAGRSLDFVNACGPVVATCLLVGRQFECSRKGNKSLIRFVRLVRSRYDERLDRIVFVSRNEESTAKDKGAIMRGK